MNKVKKTAIDIDEVLAIGLNLLIDFIGSIPVTVVAKGGCFCH